MRTPPRFFFPRSVHTPRFRHGRGRSQPQNLGEAVNETHDVRDRESCAHLSPIHSPPLVRQSQPLRSRQPESTTATRKSCLKREIAELVVHGTSRRTREKYRLVSSRTHCYSSSPHPDYPCPQPQSHHTLRNISPTPA